MRSQTNFTLRIYTSMESEPTDLYQDMETLNTLYEELMWDHDDQLEFTPDYKNDRIVIRNKSKDNRKTRHSRLDSLD